MSPALPRRGPWALLALIGVALLPSLARAEILYFKVEVRQEGRLVAHPHLLGETGKALHAIRKAPGATQPDYSLKLLPRVEGDHYALSLGFSMGAAGGSSALELGHGQRRQIQLSGGDKIEISVLLMRVDSPEFRAYMDLRPGAPSADDAARAI